ncbi:MAG: sortase [Anaerolineaceae bacterium]|nr:sortase [Anaerolineaceae bacterium]
MKTVRPHDLGVLRHEELDWVTLITCKGYDQTSDLYNWRTVIQAVLVEVREE